MGSRLLGRSQGRPGDSGRIARQTGDCRHTGEEDCMFMEVLLGVKIAPEGSRLFGGACFLHKIKTGTSSRRWRSVARGYWRSLHKTKLAAASPFHCCLVSPGSKKAFVRAFRTMLTNGVSPMRETRSVTAITRVCNSRGSHNSDCISPCSVPGFWSVLDTLFNYRRISSKPSRTGKERGLNAPLHRFLSRG